jgi:4-hydroxy-2-oxoheptanedioate aldolase
MDIKKRDFLSLGLGAGLAATSAAAQPATAPRPPAGGGTPRPGTPVNSNVQPSSVDFNYKPRRLNKMIELWEDNQPVYYINLIINAPGDDPYAIGVKYARTFADAIIISMEHDSTLDYTSLRCFMKGLVEGGPTRSGHRTPAVIAECPVIGLDEPYMRANSWVLGALLDCGVMGVHLCHARDPKAVEVAAHMALRYPFDYPDTPKVAMRGLRGSSATFAAQTFGVSTNKYCHIADLWPLNPHGELVFGVKIEDTYADANAAKTLAVPGVAFAEWGPGDHNYWLNGLPALPEAGGGEASISSIPNMVAVRKNALELSKKNNVRFLNSAGADVVAQLKDGVMLISSNNEQAAITGREYSKRRMPV